VVEQSTKGEDVRYAKFLIVSVLLGLSGCGVLQGVLSIDQAVARLVPNDPLSATYPNHFIGAQEIAQSTQLWIDGRPVPRTGGQHITDETMQKLIALWKQHVAVP